MADPTIHTDVEDNAFDDGGFDPVDAFLKGLVGDQKSTEEAPRKRKEKPQEAPEPEAEPEEDEETEEQAEGGDEDPDGEETDDEDDGETPEKRAIADEDEVEITVDGETRKASVKDLKRLYGQEAALTRKAQEVAQARRVADEQAVVYQTGLTKMKEAAEARWKEFEAVDYLQARDTMDAQAFQNLRNAATRAYQEYKFFDQELQGYTQKAAQEHQQRLQGAARDCIKALTSDVREDGTPNPHKIEGWNDTIYNDLRSFAVQELGASQQAIDTLVDPVAIKVLWMAQQYAKAQKAAKATAKPKPVVQAPKKVLTSKTSVEPTASKSSKQKAAMQRLRQSGSVDAGADAFLAMFGGGED